ncbi:enoyl-CoA hydratase/isomerase family protein [bacterium]|nr:enoyl-CoA hydratase/isomerase family protein [bacterium]
MKYEQILYEIRDQIALITLNRPEKMNAWTFQMKDEMIAAFDSADKDDNVRVVVVTGSGKAFCAGADLDPSRFGDRQKSDGLTNPPRDSAGQLTTMLYNIKKPVIAAINGHAVGVGSTMTLAMDIRIIAENAKMGFVFNRRGLVPEGCSTWFLPRLVGIGKASEWMHSGRLILADEALTSGLVNRVVPVENLMDTAMEVANEIAANTSALSTAFTRQMLWQMLGADHPMEAHKIESKCLHFMFSTDDFQEGLSSFLEKREARFPLKPEKDLPPFYPWWTQRTYDTD